MRALRRKLAEGSSAAIAPPLTQSSTERAARRAGRSTLVSLVMNRRMFAMISTLTMVLAAGVAVQVSPPRRGASGATRGRSLGVVARAQATACLAHCQGAPRRCARRCM